MALLAINGGEPVLQPPFPEWPPADEEVRQALEACWRDGSWGKYEGPYNSQVVERLAELHHVCHVLPCSSGTIGIELALRGVQVGADDEVILAAYDFSGNFRAIETLGATPVLVDILPDWCIDPDAVRSAVSSRTRALIVSHLHGGLADMRQLRAIAEQHQLAIVEDACQAHGATVQGRLAGAWGDVSVLSFGGSKLVTAGRGGALMTNRDDIYQRAKVYCERGNNAFPLSELQAAVLPPQLAKLAERNRKRIESVERLLTHFTSNSPLRPNRPREGENTPSYFKLAFEFDSTECGAWPRERFVAAAQAEGVLLDAGFRGFLRRSPRRCRQVGTLENSRRAAEATLVLHHPVLLEDQRTIDLVAHALHKVIRFAHSTR